MIGIKFRRNNKDQLHNVKPGEVVFAVDTNEWGLGLTNGEVHWRLHDVNFEKIITSSETLPAKFEGEEGEYYYYSDPLGLNSGFFQKQEGVWYQIHIPLSRIDANLEFQTKNSVSNYDDNSTTLTTDASVTVSPEYLSTEPLDVVTKLETRKRFGFLLSDGSFPMDLEYEPTELRHVLTKKSFSEGNLTFTPPTVESDYVGCLWNHNGNLRITDSGNRHFQTLGSYQIKELEYDGYNMSSTQIEFDGNFVLVCGYRRIFVYDVSDFSTPLINIPSNGLVDSETLADYPGDTRYAKIRNGKLYIRDVYNDRIVVMDILTQDILLKITDENNLAFDFYKFNYEITDSNIITLGTEGIGIYDLDGVFLRYIDVKVLESGEIDNRYNYLCVNGNEILIGIPESELVYRFSIDSGALLGSIENIGTQDFGEEIRMSGGYLIIPSHDFYFIYDTSYNLLGTINRLSYEQDFRIFDGALWVIFNNFSSSYFKIFDLSGNLLEKIPLPSNTVLGYTFRIRNDGKIVTSLYKEYEILIHEAI